MWLATFGLLVTLRVTCICVLFPSCLYMYAIKCQCLFYFSFLSINGQGYPMDTQFLSSLKSCEL